MKMADLIFANGEKIAKFTKINSLQITWYTVLLVSPHVMRGRELSTLVVILSFILCVTLECHFEAVRKQDRAFYIHRSFSTAGKSLLLLLCCI